MTRRLSPCEVFEEEHYALYGEKIPYWEIHDSDVRDVDAAAERLRVTVALPKGTESERRRVLVEFLNTSMAGDLAAGDEKVAKKHGLDPDTAAGRAETKRRVIDEKAGDALLPLSDSTRLKAYHRAVHKRGSTSALCLSGGGIRSATFGLGVLQGLARRNVLDKFDFLSTVSGGGYIGSWLSSWMRRHPQGPRGVATELAKVPDDPKEPEPAPIRHLRAHSNFLTPRVGIASGDTWALAATYVRNVILNWTVLVPLLLVVLLVPRLVAGLYFNDPVADFASRVDDIFPLAFVAGWLTRWSSSWWLVGLGAFCNAIALFYLGSERPIDNRYKTIETPAEEQKQGPGPDARFHAFCLVPLIFGAIFLSAAWIRYSTGTIQKEQPLRFPLTAVWILLGAPLLVWLIHTIRHRRYDAAERRESVAGEIRAGRGLWQRWRKPVYELAAAAAGGLVSYLLLGWVTLELFPVPNRGIHSLLAFPAPVLPALETAPVPALYVCFAVPLVLAALFVSSAIFVGVASEVNKDYDREWWSRCSGWVLAVMVLWPIVCAIVIFGPILILMAPKAVSAAGGVVGVATVLLGHSSKTGRNKGAEQSPRSELTAKLLAPAVILFILAGLSLLTSRVIIKTDGVGVFQLGEARFVDTARWTVPEGTGKVNGVETFIASGRYPVYDRERARGWNHLRAFYGSSVSMLGGTAIMLFLWAAAAAGIINVNQFSMHAMYRNRLMRAYLGASRTSRDPNPFTGFDPHDNLPMHELRPELLWYHSFADFPRFLKRLETPETEFDLQLRLHIEQRKPGLLDQKMDEDAKRVALFQVINCVMEEEDPETCDKNVVRSHELPESGLQRLTHKVKDQVKQFLGPGDGVRPLRGRDPQRLRANRRKLEENFPEEIIPLDAPLLQRSDIGDPKSFRAAFHSGFGKRLASRFRDPALPTELDVCSLSYPRTLGMVIDEINRLMGAIHFEELLQPKPASYETKRGAARIRSNRQILDREFTASAPMRDEVAGAESTEPVLPPLHTLRMPRPMQMVNAALNLVNGANLAWQERKAESFTFSPLHSGTQRLGYRASSEYGGTTGVTLGTAMTISGAAASPNMGYHSAAPLAFLLTIFNVRLGWWLGNPGKPGDDCFMKDGPRNALGPLKAELTGSTNDRYSYIYLSDGGHFENLGLYEMVARRRRYIFVSDAGCDEDYKFEDLGNAIRKIRTDFGIPVEMEEPMYLYPRSAGENGKYCAFGRIRYSCVDHGAPDGELLYVKPAVYLDEPKDIYNYAKASKTFPHETTADQFFSETQFESYRMLGSHVIEQLSAGAAEDLVRQDEKNKEKRQIAVGNWTASSVRDFFAKARKHIPDSGQREATAVTVRDRGRVTLQIRGQ